MTVEYEPAPRPAPLWLLPLVIALLALALLLVAQRYSDREVGGFGGRAQPTTPKPETLADGTALPAVPDELSDRFGDEIVVARRLSDVPDKIRGRCREAYADEDDPALRDLDDFIQSSNISATHLGPDALTHLSIAVDDAPPGYPTEVEIACVAERDDDRWRTPSRPYVDFALDGRPGATLRGTPRPAPAGGRTPPLRTRLVQVPVGAQWAVQPRGGWWLAYEVPETSWLLMTLNDAITDRDPLRVVFVDATGEVVEDRPVGPTRSAAQGDHSADYEIVAGSVREILDKVERRPVRACEPGDHSVCVWLSLNDLGEVLAYAAFGPHPLDTPPMGYVGYCRKANQMQGSVTAARFRTDGTWAGGPNPRGLDRYTVRFEAGKVVVDLSEHVTGDPASGKAQSKKATCEFTGKPGGRPA